VKKVALVTGAAKRLGKDLAIRLGSMGYFVYIHYQNSKKEADSVLKKIKDLGSDGRLIQADISKYSQVLKLADTLKKTSKNIDVLVNNVGEYHTGDLSNFPVAKFESIIQTNLLGSYYVIDSCLPLFRKSGGSIINIGYTGLLSLSAAPKTTAYTISKTGLVILTKSYAVSLAEKKIRVNMISPGQLENSVDLPENIELNIPLGRPGKSQDITDMLEYLTGKSGEYITGQNIEVAGGFMMTLKS